MRARARQGAFRATVHTPGVRGRAACLGPPSRLCPSTRPRTSVRAVRAAPSCGARHMPLLRRQCTPKGRLPPTAVPPEGPPAKDFALWGRRTMGIRVWPPLIVHSSADRSLAYVPSHRAAPPCGARHAIVSLRRGRSRFPRSARAYVQSYGSHTRGEGQSRLPRSSLPFFSRLGLCRARLTPARGEGARRAAPPCVF